MYQEARRKGVCVINPNAIGFGVNVFVFGPKTTPIEKYLGSTPSGNSKEALTKLVPYLPAYLDPEVVELAATQVAGRSVAAPDFATGVIHDQELAARVRTCHQVLDHPKASLLAQQSALLSMLGLWVKRYAAEHIPEKHLIPA